MVHAQKKKKKKKKTKKISTYVQILENWGSKKIGEINSKIFFLGKLFFKLYILGVVSISFQKL